MRFIGKDTRGWLPLLGKQQRNGAEDRLIQGFLAAEFSRGEISRVGIGGTSSSELGQEKQEVSFDFLPHTSFTPFYDF